MAQKMLSMIRSPKVYSNKIDRARQKAVTPGRSWTAGRYLELYERL